MAVTRAVVLLSGGMDSATCLAIARAEGCECHALSIDYGQRHGAELAAAARIAALQAFLLERVDGWFIAAGETYDPKSRKATSVITAVFKSGDTAIARFGYSPALLETPGCEVEVILVLSPAESEKVSELLSEAYPSG
jgi:hypothetical protein